MPAPLRLVVVASTLPVGGTERVLETLALGLPEHGIELHLLCLREPGELGRRIAERTGCRLLADVAPARFAPWQVPTVRRALASLAPDAVLVLDHSNAMLYGGLAARRLGLRATVTPIHSTRRPDGSPSLGRIDRHTVRWSRRVVALSPRHAAYVRDELGVPNDRLVIIPNGVDTERFSPDGPAADLPPNPDARMRLGIVAALRPEKNHAFLLRTLADLPPAERPLLHVVGDGALRPELESLARRLGLDADVHWLGLRHDVPAVLRALDALVLPSQDVVETFPVSVLEAMACAVPVVVSDVGAVRDMLEDDVHGRIVAVGDGPELARALVALGADAERRTAMGRAARAHVVTHFTRQRMIDGYAALVRELVASAH